MIVDVLKWLLVVLIIIALAAFLISVVGALGALLTGHLRWIELSWVSIAASLLALVLVVVLD